MTPGKDANEQKNGRQDVLLTNEAGSKNTNDMEHD